MIMSDSLKDIAKEIEATGKPKRMRVRRLLALVGQERRGKHVTKAIRALLRRHRLKCNPDFANVHVDTPIWLTLGPKLGRPARSDKGIGELTVEAEEIPSIEIADETEDEVEIDAAAALQEGAEISQTEESEQAETDSAGIATGTETEEREVVVTIRQGIPAGGRPPMLVRGNESVHSALTKMIDQDFSQLVVANGERARHRGYFQLAIVWTGHSRGPQARTSAGMYESPLF